MNDDEVIEQLTKVKGIGRWTAEMFLIFSLGRPNVLPLEDLGLQKAIQKWYGFDNIPSKEEIRNIAKKWEPYCTVATWYLWKASE
jgi:DNA-3-methyladenine glycosylase II